MGETKAIRIQDTHGAGHHLTNGWKRPIYFAVTCAPDSKIGLDEYLWFHGLAWRLEPRRIHREDLGLNREILEANLYDEPDRALQRPPGTATGSAGSMIMSVYYDENTSCA